jgi:hypothetical protein
MSAFKQFLASDVIVTPFEVNKGFTFPYSQFATGSDGQLVGIDRFLGTNVNWFEDQSTTGTLTTEYKALIYNSVKQLYYSNFLFSSTGDNVAQPVLFPGAGPSGSGDVLIGGVESPLYDNFLQSTLVPNRYFPTASNSEFALVSIPSKIYGDYPQPDSFIFEYSSSLTIVDDGEGNLNSSEFFEWTSSIASQTITASAFSIVDSQNIDFDPPITPPSGYTFVSATWVNGVGDSPFYNTDTSTYVASINASQGIDIGSSKIQTDESIITFQDNGTPFPSDIYLYFTSGSATSGSVEAGENVGNIIYPHGMAVLTNQNLPLSDITTLANVTCSFSSSYTIYETQYKCTIRESEFNCTLNPSAQVSGSINVVNSSSFYLPFDGTLANNVTGSYFSPYVTTVGLYDEAQNLLAIGKLSQPLPTSATTDTTILINLDR